MRCYAVRPFACHIAHVLLVQVLAGFLAHMYHLALTARKKKKGLDEDCNITATDLTRDHNVVCTNANRTQNTLVLPSPPTVSLTCVRCDGVVQSSNASERQRAESRGGVTVGKYVAVDGAEGLSLSLTRAVYA